MLGRKYISNNAKYMSAKVANFNPKTIAKGKAALTKRNKKKK